MMTYLPALFMTTLRAATENRAAALTMAVFMLIQNLIMFAVWMIYFDNFSTLNGWTLKDMGTLWGVIAFAYGVAFLLCGGAQDIGQAISDGSLDVHLGRPANVLLSLMVRDSRLSGVGDVVTAFLIWFGLVGYSLTDLPLLLWVALCAAVVMLATVIALNAMVFFLPKSNQITDQLYESFIIISHYPITGFPFMVRLVLLTVIPAGFVGHIPVTSMRTLDPTLFALMGLAAAGYMAVAVFLFYAGLRRYTSGNQFLAMK